MLLWTGIFILLLDLVFFLFRHRSKNISSIVIFIQKNCSNKLRLYAFVPYFTTRILRVFILELWICRCYRHRPQISKWSMLTLWQNLIWAGKEQLDLSSVENFDNYRLKYHYFLSFLAKKKKQFLPEALNFLF